MHRHVVRLSASGRDDFFRLHSEANDAGWCQCVAWWVPTWDGWGDRTAEANRRLREELLDRGEYDGYLLYADGQPVGWCQVGPRDRLVKLVEAYPKRGEGVDAADVWTGPEALWRAAGFQVVRDDPRRPILAIEW